MLLREAHNNAVMLLPCSLEWLRMMEVQQLLLQAFQSHFRHSGLLNHLAGTHRTSMFTVFWLCALFMDFKTQPPFKENREESCLWWLYYLKTSRAGTPQAHGRWKRHSLRKKSVASWGEWQRILLRMMVMWVPDKESAATVLVPVLFTSLCEPSVGATNVRPQKNDSFLNVSS